MDWDTLRLAPPERDLWMVLDESADLSGYRAAGGRARVDDRTLRLYRLWWDLSEIASFVGWFRDTHARTADTAIAWEALANYLPVRQHWPEIADRGSPRRR